MEYFYSLIRRTKKMLNSIIPRDSALGVVLRRLYDSVCYPYHICVGAVVRMRLNRAVKPLVDDIDILNARIAHIKASAESESSPKSFYIIRRESKAGLFSFVHTSFAHVIYALAKGMIPIVDMQNYLSPYLEDDKLGKENAWEYYFKQPCRYGLDDTGRNVRYSSLHFWQSLLPLLILQSRDKRYSEFFELWSEVYRNFFALSDDASQYIEEEYKRLIKPDMRVIGVYCRGTDYVKMRPRDHPAQPNVQDVIGKVNEVMQEWNCDFIYITTEERKTVELFEKAFPGKVLYANQMFYDDIDYDYGSNFITGVNFDRENDTYLKGLQYLSSVIIFSRCTSAVISLCGGSVSAMYINGGKYENTYIFDLGLYP